MPHSARFTSAIEQLQPQLEALGISHDEILQLESDKPFVAALFRFLGASVDPGLHDKIDWWLESAQDKQEAERTSSEQLMVALMANSFNHY